MIIYLVIGSRGEYSDHSEWPIKAFRDKESADKFANEFPYLLKNVTDYYEKTSQWYREQCIANGVWIPTNPNWSQVRGAIWDEKRRKEIEVEKQYVGDYSGPKDKDSEYYPLDIPDTVSIVEVDLV